MILSNTLSLTFRKPQAYVEEHVIGLVILVLVKPIRKTVLLTLIEKRVRKSLIVETIYLGFGCNTTTTYRTCIGVELVATTFLQRLANVVIRLIFKIQLTLSNQVHISIAG